MSAGRLFVYGRLRDSACVVGLLGRMPEACVAVLADHRCEVDPASGLVAARPAPGYRLAGVLYEGLQEADWDRLDAFEEIACGLYVRRAVRVRLVGAGAVERDAQIYLAGPAFPLWPARPPAAAGQQADAGVEEAGDTTDPELSDRRVPEDGPAGGAEATGTIRPPAWRGSRACATARRGRERP